MTQPSQTPSPWTTPPSQQHLADIAAAKTLGARVRRTYVVAMFSAWTLAIFAGLSLAVPPIFGVFSQLLGESAPGITSYIPGVVLAVIAYVEFKGAAGVKRLDLRAPRMLALNQLVFAILLFLYGAVSLWTNLSDTAWIQSMLVSDADTADMLGIDFEALARMIIVILYGGVMLAALLGPGLTALWYATRRKHMQAYVSQTAKWILDLQRAGMSI